MEEQEQVQQAALELALLCFQEAAPPLWQEPGQVGGRVLQAGVLGSPLCLAVLHRVVLAPQLQLEGLLEGAGPLEVDTPLRLPLRWIPR